MGSYVTPALLGGTDGALIGNQIAVQFLDLANHPLGSAMALLIMALILLVVTWMLRRSGPQQLYGQ